MKTNKMISITSMLFALQACQTIYVPQARDVKRKPHVGGVIALKTEHRDEDRQKADSIMKSNCGNLSIKILEEGEVVTGQETKTTGNETNRDDSRSNVGSLFGIPLTSGSAAGKETQQSATISQLKEWQISYECEELGKKIKNLNTT